MPILKFGRSYDAIVLEKLLMVDITKDQRTSLLNRSDFICQKYKIDTNVYIAKNDLFFKMAKILNTSRIRIDAMIIHEGKDNIVIVPTRSYVFWNGRSRIDVPSGRWYTHSGRVASISSQISVARQVR